MRLYQLVTKTVGVIVPCMVLLLSACNALQPKSPNLIIGINADGENQEVEVPAGTTTREALGLVGIEMATLDKSTPPLYAVLQDGDEIVITRVVEEYVVEQSILPYETQVIRNESLPEGEQRLIQPGETGIQETTYRVLYEDGVEVSRSVNSTIVVQAAKPEIVMVGSQAAFAELPIPGILAYVSGGNAWLMEKTTGERRPVVTTGDLDGRIFSVSPDGRWLMYTRSGNGENEINSLWVTYIEYLDGESFDLGIKNVIHFADWIPGTQNGIVYSTAVTTPSPPGWQANNDLVFVNFSEETGWTSSPRVSIETNSGGLYGWWGTDFAYSPDGESMAYARPDSFGLVDFEYDRLSQLFEMLPVQTGSDWAWVPPVSWSPDGNYIFFVNHVPQEGLAEGEGSPLFDLAVYPFVGGGPATIAHEVGMFAYPLASPLRTLETGELAFQIAFLKAISPTQSRTSAYQLMLMDRDGSNLRMIYPKETDQGLTPHRFCWLPDYAIEEYPAYIALIDKGNLYLVDVDDPDDPHQLTGDGLVTALDWN